MKPGMSGLFFGTIIGMLLAAAVVTNVFFALEQRDGVNYGKTPAVYMTFIGVPVGGILGGLVGRWVNTTSHTR